MKIVLIGESKFSRRAGNKKPGGLRKDQRALHTYRNFPSPTRATLSDKIISVNCLFLGRNLRVIKGWTVQIRPKQWLEGQVRRVIITQKVPNSMTLSRLERLQNLTATTNLAAVALVPGPDLGYFSGLQFHL